MQALEVDKVKAQKANIIVDPVYLSPKHNIRDTLAIMERYHIWATNYRR